jgi:hypothetical protein
MNIIPDQLNITILTSIPGYQKIEYNPSMTITNINEKVVRFNPLIKLNTSLINKIPDEYKIKEFFNKGLFQSLLAYAGVSPVTNLMQATHSGYIDNNIKVTLDTIFPTNSIIYIGKEPYVIGDVQWTTGDWKLEVKQKKQEIDINKVTDPILYSELVKEELLSGEKQLAELPKGLLSGNNYNGPPVLDKSIEDTLKSESQIKPTEPESQIKPTEPESQIKPTEPESKDLVKYKPLKPLKLLKPLKNESAGLVKYEKQPEIQKNIEPLKKEDNNKKALQIENEPSIPVSSKIEEITPEEEALYDIIKQNLKYSIDNTGYLISYFKSNIFYNILNSLYLLFTKPQQNMIIDFYKLTTNTLIKPNSTNLSRTAYNNLAERISIIKTIENGNCFFEAVATGINIHNMENFQDKITYANYGITQIFTIQIIREIVFRYIDNFTNEEKNNLLEYARVFSNDLNNIFKKQINGLNLSNEQYIENVNSVYHSSDNFLVYKPESMPIIIDEYNIPFRALRLNEIEKYIKSKDYWANNTSINAVCEILKINIITIEKYDKILRMPYLNFNKERLCKDKCMFLFYKQNHYDLIRFNYNVQSVEEKGVIKKLLNIKKYYTIFNINKLLPPLHILFFIYGSYYIKLDDESKLKFSFYKNIMNGFDISIKKKIQLLNNKEFNTFTNNFNHLFPGENRLNNLYKKLEDNTNPLEHDEIEKKIGGAISYNNKNLYNKNLYNNNNVYNNKNLIKKTEESKIAYSIIIVMELYQGTSLTPEKLKELKCNSKYNMVRKAYATFTGNPYIIPPVYNKTNKNNNNQKKSKTKKNK